MPPIENKEKNHASIRNYTRKTISKFTQHANRNHYTRFNELSIRVCIHFSALDMKKKREKRELFMVEFAGEETVISKKEKEKKEQLSVSLFRIKEASPVGYITTIPQKLWMINKGVTKHLRQHGATSSTSKMCLTGHPKI